MAQYFTTSLYQLDDTTNGYLRQPFPIHVDGITDMNTYFHGNFVNSQTGFGKCLTASAGWEFGTYKFYSDAQMEALLGMGTIGGATLGGNFIIEWKAYTPTEGPLGIYAYPVNTIPVNPSSIKIPGLEVFRYATRAGFYIKVFISKTIQDINEVPVSFVNGYTTVSLLAVFPDGTYSTSSTNIPSMAGDWHNFRVVKDADKVKFYTDNFSESCSIDVAKAFEVDQYGGTAWFRPVSWPADGSAITLENYFSFYSSETGYCIDEVRTLLCGFEIYKTFPVDTTPTSPTIPNISAINIAKISVGDVIDPTIAFPYGATVIEVGSDYIVLSQPAAVQLSQGNLTVRTAFPDTTNPAKPPYVATEIQRIGEITVGDTKITELKQDPTTAGYDSFISSLSLINDAGEGKVFVKTGSSDTAWTELVKKGTITLSSIAQSGATTGQVPSWNGTTWAASTPSSGASTDLSNVANTSVSADLIPSTDNQKNIGAALKRWMSIFATKIVDATDKIVLNITSRLLVNSAGDAVLDFSSTNLNALSKKITSLANGIDNGDAVNLSQLKDPTNITQDATHRFVTDTQITTWNGVSSNEPAITAGTTSQYWRGDKSWQTLDKSAIGLSSVPNVDATVASNITQDSTHRFVTDTEKSNWNTALITDTAISNGDIDWTTGTTFYKSVSADTTFTFSNTVAGKDITVVVVNSNASSYINITFPAGIVSVGGSALNGYILPSSSKSFKFTKSNSTIYSESAAFPQQVALSTFSGSTVWPLVKSYFGSTAAATMTIPCIGSKNGDIVTVAVQAPAGGTTVSFTASDATAVTFFSGMDGIIAGSKICLFTVYRINGYLRIRKDSVT